MPASNNIRTRSHDLIAVLLQMIEELYAEGVPREVTLDIHEEIHRLAQALLESQPVVLRGRRRSGRMGHAVHAVFGMRMHWRYG